MRVGVDSLDGTDLPTNRPRVQFSSPRTCQGLGRHHDCGMFALPKHPDDCADFARLEASSRTTRNVSTSSPTSTTIKERDGVVFSFILILETHEATTVNGNFLPRSHLPSPASLLSPVDQLKDVNGRVRPHLTLITNYLLTYVLFLQETTGYYRRVEAIDEHGG